LNDDVAQNRHWLEVAEARIRTLELQLFERDKELQDRDVELSSLLDAPTPPNEKATRRATRHRFAKTTKIQLDGANSELVDLSIGGAQLLCSKQPEVNSSVTLTLTAEGGPLECAGRVVWAMLEPHSKGKPLRYRAGLLFTSADEAAIEMFIAKQAG
jgi:PilZ domain